ncbi:MAG TPA: twin-arginine translocase subunit TatC [Terriglobales bacterium]|jgi:sec-independent protein translocase protein TatC
MSTPVLETAQKRASEEMTGMSFLEHLEELRRRIVHTVLYILAGFGICWWFHERIFAVMQRPIMAALAKNHLDSKLVYLNPTDPFNMYIKISLLAGLFLASPFVLYQVWAFIAPGLYRNERRYVMPFMVSTVGLFVAGGYFGYKMVYPGALDFLIHFSGQFQPMITVGEYTDLFLTIIAGLGVVFEMPILIFFLALMGIVSAGWMWRNFRYAILAIFVISGIISPTPDITNMCIFAAPMIVLYLFSIAIAWFVHPTQRKKRAAKAAGQ